MQRYKVTNLPLENNKYVNTEEIVQNIVWRRLHFTMPTQFTDGNGEESAILNEAVPNKISAWQAMFGAYQIIDNEVIWREIQYLGVDDYFVQTDKRYSIYFRDYDSSFVKDLPESQDTTNKYVSGISEDGLNDIYNTGIVVSVFTYKMNDDVSDIQAHLRNNLRYRLVMGGQNAVYEAGVGDIWVTVTMPAASLIEYTEDEELKTYLGGTIKRDSFEQSRGIYGLEGASGLKAAGAKLYLLTMLDYISGEEDDVIVTTSTWEG